jgi:hypothetical protein
MSLPRDIGELVARLSGNPRVASIVRYGSRLVSDNSPGGDLDLFVIVDGPTGEVESVHLWMGHIPVDLNVRSMDDLERADPLTFIDVALAGGEVVYDRDGTLAPQLGGLARRWGTAHAPLTEHDVAWERFCHAHLLAKVRQRLDIDPLLAELLMHSGVVWLLPAYFRLRGLPFEGEKRALAWLRAHDADTLAILEAFYAADRPDERLGCLERLAGVVLAPIGGLWRRDEVLALGRGPDVDDLQVRGRELLAELLGDDASSSPHHDG